MSKKRLNFILDQALADRLKQLADVCGITQTKVLELMLDSRIGSAFQEDLLLFFGKEDFVQK